MDAITDISEREGLVESKPRVGTRVRDAIEKEQVLIFNWLYETAVARLLVRARD